MAGRIVKENSEKVGAFLSRVKKSVTLSKSEISVDYPQEGEKIISGHYAVRISAPAGAVEISVNGSDWQPCRSDSGYFWFDWWPTEAGKYKLTARMNAGDGSSQKSKVRSCTVVGPSSS